MLVTTTTRGSSACPEHLKLEADTFSITGKEMRLSRTDLHPPTAMGLLPLTAALRRTATTPSPLSLQAIRGPKDHLAVRRWRELRHLRPKITRQSVTAAGTTLEARWQRTAAVPSPAVAMRTSSQDKAGAQADLREHTSRFLTGSPLTTRAGIPTPLTLVLLPQWPRLPLIVELRLRDNSLNRARSRNHLPSKPAAKEALRPGAASTC